MSDDLRVEGSATLYRLYDIGYAIALDRVADLLGERTRGRMRPGRLEAKAIQIRNPPLLANLGSFELDIGGTPQSATLSAHLFDFGVCSMQVHVRSAVGQPWSGFAEFCTAVAASPHVVAIVEREVHALVDRIASAVDRPEVAPLSEDYNVYRVDRFQSHELEEGEKTVADLLSDQQLVELLVGEHQRLSVAARRELMPHRFSYYAEDLTVLTWESALVVEPRVEDRDVEYVLEFANAQLLELRMFDLQLDAELPALYDRAEAARRRPRRSGRFRGVLSDLQTRVADVTETVERVENALKVTNDVYLARIYAAALDLFREQAWRRGIERKLGILRETYAMLNSEAQAARAELLEVAIVLLIVIELLVGIFRAA